MMIDVITLFSETLCSIRLASSVSESFANVEYYDFYSLNQHLPNPNHFCASARLFMPLAFTHPFTLLKVV